MLHQVVSKFSVHMAEDLDFHLYTAAVQVPKNIKKSNFITVPFNTSSSKVYTFSTSASVH
jgi:hypothetical protein